MGCCPAIGCKNRSGKKKTPGITFHRFPSDLAKRQLWVEALKRKDWTPNLTTCLCSAHFKEEEIDRTANLVRIRVGAVPSVFPTSSSRKISRKKHLLESQGTATPHTEIRAKPSTEILPKGWSEEKLHLHNEGMNDEKIVGGARTGHLYSPCNEEIRELTSRSQHNKEITSHSKSSTESNDTETLPRAKERQGFLDENMTIPNNKEPSESGKFQILSDSNSDKRNREKIKKKSTINKAQCSISSTTKTGTCTSSNSNGQKESHVENTLETQLQRKEERIRTLKKKIRQLQQTSRRMTRRVTHLKEVVNNMKTHLRSQETHHATLDDFPGTFWFLVKRQMIKKRGGKLQRIYNDKLRDFALTLNFMSPPAYDYVRRVLGDCLPHRKTISKWILKNRKQPVKDSKTREQTLEERSTLTEQCVLGDVGLVGAPGYVEVVRSDPELSNDTQGIRLGDDTAERTLISL